jgi:hypothetical protein
MLLDHNGDVVRMTKTDSYGYYSFKNLPDGKYKVHVALGMDQPDVDATFEVDVTQKSIELNIAITAGTLQSSTHFLQTITFAEFEPIPFTTEPVPINVSIDSGLPLFFETSDPSIAEIVDEQLTIHHTGIVSITAYSPGDDTYAPARVLRDLQIVKASQSITFEPLEEVFERDTIALQATASSGLPVTFSSSDPTVAKVVDDNLIVMLPGPVTITASQAGDDNYLAATDVKQLDKIVFILGVENPLAALSVAPNPTTGLVTLSGDVVPHHVALTDITGRSQTLMLRGRTLDISSVEPGVYFLSMLSGNYKRVVKVVRK